MRSKRTHNKRYRSYNKNSRGRKVRRTRRTRRQKTNNIKRGGRPKFKSVAKMATLQKKASKKAKAKAAANKARAEAAKRAKAVADKVKKSRELAKSGREKMREAAQDAANKARDAANKARADMAKRAEAAKKANALKSDGKKKNKFGDIVSKIKDAAEGQMPPQSETLPVDPVVEGVTPPVATPPVATQPPPTQQETQPVATQPVATPPVATQPPPTQPPPTQPPQKEPTAEPKNLLKATMGDIVDKAVEKKKEITSKLVSKSGNKGALDYCTMDSDCKELMNENKHHIIAIEGVTKLKIIDSKDNTITGLFNGVPTLGDIEIDGEDYNLKIEPEEKDFEKDEKNIYIFWGEAVEKGIITVIENGYIYTNKGKTGVTVDPEKKIVKATMNLNKNKTPNDYDVMRLSTLAAMAWLHLQKNHNIKWN